MSSDPYITDVSALGISALCVEAYDPWQARFHPELSPGETYRVTHVRMTTDITYIRLEGKDGNYNSVSFKFMIEGKAHNIYSDERCRSEMLKHRLARTERNSNQTK